MPTMGDKCIGSYTGTGSAINVPIGWVPDFVMIVNVTDGDIIWTWFSGQAAGTSVDIAAAVAANANNAITALESTTACYGFTAGTDFSESGKVYGYVALMSDHHRGGLV